MRSIGSGGSLGSGGSMGSFGGGGSLASGGSGAGSSAPWWIFLLATAFVLGICATLGSVGLLVGVWDSCQIYCSGAAEVGMRVMAFLGCETRYESGAAMQFQSETRELQGGATMQMKASPVFTQQILTPQAIPMSGSYADQGRITLMANTGGGYTAFSSQVVDAPLANANLGYAPFASSPVVTDVALANTGDGYTAVSSSQVVNEAPVATATLGYVPFLSSQAVNEATLPSQSATLYSESAALHSQSAALQSQSATFHTQSAVPGGEGRIVLMADPNQETYTAYTAH